MECIKKEEKRKMKVYDLITKDNFTFYLYQLVCRCYKILKEQDRYLDKLSKYISEAQRKNILVIAKRINVPYEDYNEFLALMGHVETFLLNIIGDLQGESLSYYKFRNIIAKRKNRNSLGFEIRDIDEEIQEILRNFNMSRNFQNHIPESLITVEEKMIEEQKLQVVQLNPLPIVVYEACTLEFIGDMYKSYIEMNRLAYRVFESMKADLTCLTGHKTEIIEIVSEKPKGIEHLEAVKMSSDIQGIKR